MSRKQPPTGFSGDEVDDQPYGEADSWYRLVGPLYRADDNQPGAVRLCFYSERRYISSMGRVHGGKMASFMDYLLFSAASSQWSGSMLVTVSLNINYVGACPPDQWVIGTGSVLHAGRSMAFVSGEARADDKLIVQATGTFRRLEQEGKG